MNQFINSCWENESAEIKIDYVDIDIRVFGLSQRAIYNWNY